MKTTPYVTSVLPIENVRPKKRSWLGSSEYVSSLE